MKCKRTVCQNEHDNCEHTQTGYLYCESCAVLINRNNPEVPGLVTIPRLEEYKLTLLEKPKR